MQKLNFWNEMKPFHLVWKCGVKINKLTIQFLGAYARERELGLCEEDIKMLNYSGLKEWQ